jgi:gamma-glutamylcyclotransferase (GGCT)/AIG2-like uncharacterized protein YtfP
VALYAAYAINLDAELMRQRCPHSPLRGSGWLEGWRLTFGGEEYGWDGALATVVESPGARVFVLVYDVLSQDEAALDEWENVRTGLFQKIRVRVHMLEGEVLAWLYVLVEGREGGLPSARYLGLLADAAEQAGAPSDYVHDLRHRPCRSAESGRGS